MRLGRACPAWSADEDSYLRKLWAVGFAVNEIAARLPGRSRNAVSGRARRLYLEPRESPADAPVNFMSCPTDPDLEP